MYIGDIEIQTLGGKHLTIKEAVAQAGIKGKFYIDVWGYWCGPCIRIKPFLQDETVLYLHLGKGRNGHTEIRTPDEYVPSPFDFACVDTTPEMLGVRGIPFVKKVDAQLRMSDERYYPGPGGMAIMNQ